MTRIKHFLSSMCQGVLNNENLDASLDAMSDLEITMLVRKYHIPFNTIGDKFPIQYTHLHNETGLFIPCSIYKFVELQEKIAQVILDS